MYHWLVRRNVQTSFAHLNAHQYEAVVSTFTPDMVHSFAGQHALGGVRHTQEAAREWYARLFRLFPDLSFKVERVVVSGLPHDTTVAVQFRVELTPPNGSKRSYFNEVAQFIRIRWGRIAEIHLYEHTDKLVGLLRDMQAVGIAEAGAVPIVD